MITILGISRGIKGQLTLMANLSLSSGDPDEIESFIVDYNPATKKFKKIKSFPGWLTGMVTAPTSELVMVSADGELVCFRSGKIQVKSLKRNAFMNGLALLPGGGYLALGDDGSAYLGKSISAKSKKYSFGSSLYGAHSFSGNKIVIVGDNGTAVYGSEKSWFRIDLNTDSCLFSAIMIDEHKFYIGGVETLFLVNIQDLSKQPRIRKVKLPDKLTCYAIEYFKGKLFVGAGENGLWAWDNIKWNQVSKAHVHALYKVDDWLAAMANNTFLYLNKGKWIKSQLDLKVLRRGKTQQ
tara:strand:- start:11458 stop:12342 length:885 start_codon:yes stop_codon:yes gene_type:complete